MSTAYERRVRRLREHVLIHTKPKEEVINKPKLSIDDMTKEEIINKLEGKGIEYNPRDKKEVLFNLLVGD